MQCNVPTIPIPNIPWSIFASGAYMKGNNLLKRWKWVLVLLTNHETVVIDKPLFATSQRYHSSIVNMLRCFTCGLAITPFYYSLIALVDIGYYWDEAFYALAVNSLCCRTSCITWNDNDRLHQAALLPSSVTNQVVDCTI
jgi:DNA-directed RNA polymerase subunit N (RpoN/RPB10)